MKTIINEIYNNSMIFSCFKHNCSNHIHTYKSDGCSFLSKLRPITVSNELPAGTVNKKARLATPMGAMMNPTVIYVGTFLCSIKLVVMGTP